MSKKSLVSITDYSREDILRILNLTQKFDENPPTADYWKVRYALLSSLSRLPAPALASKLQ